MSEEYIPYIIQFPIKKHLTHFVQKYSNIIIKWVWIIAFLKSGYRMWNYFYNWEILYIFTFKI